MLASRTLLLSGLASAQQINFYSDTSCGSFISSTGDTSLDSCNPVPSGAIRSMLLVDCGANLCGSWHLSPTCSGRSTQLPTPPQADSTDQKKSDPEAEALAGVTCACSGSGDDESTKGCQTAAGTIGGCYYSEELPDLSPPPKERRAAHW
jgi:hypothetical protein